MPARCGTAAAQCRLAWPAESPAPALLCAQICLTLFFPLPTGAHVLVTLLTTADYMRHSLTAQCSAARPAPPWALFVHARGEYQQLAALLDHIFLWAPLGGTGVTSELASRVSDDALCYSLTFWAHISVCLIGSMALAYAMDRQAKARAAAAAGRGRPAPWLFTAAEAAVTALSLSALLWCMLRTGTLKRLGGGTEQGG